MNYCELPSRTTMASYLCICMNCGQYVKGTSPLLIGTCETHMCNLVPAQIKKNMNECKAILSTLLIENGEEEKDSKVTSNQGAPVPPPLPPPLPRSALLQLEKFELMAKLDDVHAELKQKLLYVKISKNVEKCFVLIFCSSLF